MSQKISTYYHYKFNKYKKKIKEIKRGGAKAKEDLESYYFIRPDGCLKISATQMSLIEKLNNLNHLGGLTQPEVQVLFPYLKMTSGQNSLAKQDADKGGVIIGIEREPYYLIDMLNNKVDIPQNVVTVAIKQYLFARYGLYSIFRYNSIKITKGSKSCRGLKNLDDGQLQVLSPDIILNLMAIPNPVNLRSYLTRVLTAIRIFNKDVIFRFEEIDSYPNKKKDLRYLEIFETLNEKRSLYFEDLLELLFFIHLINQPAIFDSNVNPLFLAQIRKAFNGVHNVGDFIREVTSMPNKMDDI